MSKFLDSGKTSGFTFLIQKTLKSLPIFLLFAFSLLHPQMLLCFFPFVFFVVVVAFENNLLSDAIV